MIARYNNISLALGVPGIIIQTIGYFMSNNPEQAGFARVLMIVGGLLLIGGLAMYAMAKGRSPAWGLMGLFSWLGLIVLALLSDNTNNKYRQY